MLKKVISHSVIYGIGNIFPAFISFIMLPLYTRYLSPSEYGILSILTATLIILQYFYDFGMTYAFIRKYYDYENSNYIKKLASTAFFFLFITSLAISILIIKTFPLFLARYIKNMEVIIYLKFILYNLFFTSLSIIPQQILRVKEKAKTFAIIITLKSILVFSFNILFLVYLDYKIKGILLSYLFSSIIIFILLIYITKDNFVFYFSLKILKDMLNFGIPFVPVLILSWLMDFSDRFLLQLFTNSHEVGLFSLGSKISQILLISISAFTFAWAPISLSILKKENAKEIYSKILTYYMIISIYLVIVLSVFSKSIINILATKEYYRSLYIIPIISISFVLYGLYRLFLIGIYVKKRSRSQPFIVGIGAILNIGLNLILIPRIGILGAAFSSVLSYLVIVIGTYIFSQSYYKIEYEIKKIITIFVIGVSIIAISNIVNNANLFYEIVIKSIMFLSFPMLLIKLGILKIKDITNLFDSLKSMFKLNTIKELP